MLRRLLLLLFVLLAAPAALPAQSLRPALFNPAADYITPGQDEPGYQRWYKAANWRPIYVRAFNDYLVANGVAGIAPTWQLLRTATEWQRCGADPFEVPPTADWANIVETLRFIRAYIVPVLGPVEPVSVYRNPMLNVCAGGAETSTHREMGAVDIVPLRPISREALMVQLCAIHTAHPDSNNGLGFYKGLRFHIDARKYREWGTAGARGGYGCTAVLAEGAAPFNPAPPTALRQPIFVTLQPSVGTAPRPIGSQPALQPTVPPPVADSLAPLGH
jgi:hypothetical protein